MPAIKRDLLLLWHATSIRSYTSHSLAYLYIFCVSEVHPTTGFQSSVFDIEVRINQS